MVDPESFTYLNEDNGDVSLLDVAKVNSDVVSLGALLFSGGTEVHRRASDELMRIRRETSASYTRLVAMRTMEFVANAQLLHTNPVELGFVFQRVVGFVMTYRGLRSPEEHEQFTGGAVAG
ncbi:MAG: hypothetical protein ACTHJI_04215 [Leifsonia sp.]